MMDQYPIHWPQFYTATILEWKHLLKPDKYKDIIVESLCKLPRFSDSIKLDSIE